MSTRSHSLRSVAGLAGLIALSSTARAQWTYEVLHPAAAYSSSAARGAAAAQGGTVQPTQGVNHAAVWNGNAASFVDLHVAGFAHSSVHGCDGVVQVGAVEPPGGPYYASMWSGTPGSWVDLNPAGAIASNAVTASGGFQGGFAVFNAIAKPGVWQGTAASFIELTPQGYNGNGAVTDIGGGMQVGYASQNGTTHAGLWTGTAASWVELSASGIAYGTDGAQQVGYLLIGGSTLHACLWSGTAASVVDLAPAGSSMSYAYAVDAGEQVGAASFPSQANHAYLWSGTAASGVDLHAFLPPTYVDSEAKDIWHANGTTYVFGTATTSTPGVTHAVIWRRLPTATYCAGKQNSAGCTPSISFTGSPSASASSGFLVQATGVRNQVPGLLLYGASGRNATPFAGGTLCVGLPFFRGPVVSSNGSTPPAVDCTGVFQTDMNAFRAGQSGGNPQPMLSIPGTIVDCQYWGRDPGFAAPNNAQLSNALEYEIGS